MTRHAAVVALLLMSAGCATVQAPPPTPQASLDGVAAVAAIRAAGAARKDELDVQPLRDAQVADLHEQARAAERAGRIAVAIALMDRALATVPADPLLLQERAELALLANQADEALAFARRAHAAGPRVGPLCRRALETELQVLRSRNAAAQDIARLETQRDACTVTPPPRY